MLKRSLILVCGLVFFGFNLFAANPVTFKITATVPVLQSLEVKNVEIPEMDEIIPTGEFSEDITADCWNVVEPIKIQIAVTNNNTTKKLVIFTNHRDTTRQGYYWPDRLASLPETATVNGLINLQYYTEATWYSNTAPLRVFTDIDDEGLPTTNSAVWEWITDVGSIVDIESYLGEQPSIAVLYDGDIIRENLDIYIKTCWDNSKEGGDYQGKLIFGIVGQ
ncbi:hypothetical protein ACFL2K_03185 [Candidatus Margulisiibacteriota bacterium]